MRVHPRLLLPTLCLLAAPVAAQAPTTAAKQAPQSIFPYLPEQTVMALSVPDLDASVGEFAAMPLAKMWHEQEVQSFVRDALEALAQQREKWMGRLKDMHTRGQLPIDPEKLLEFRVRSATFAVTKLDLTMAEAAPPLPEFGMLLHIDLGPAAATWFGLVDMGLGLLQQSGHMEREDVAVGEQKIACFTPQHAPPGLRMGLNVAQVGTGLIVGTLVDDVRSVIENLQKGTPVLVASKRYKECAQHLDAGGAEVQMYFRPDPLLDAVVKVAGLVAKMEPSMSDLDPEGIARAIDALGLRAMGATTAASTYRDGKAVWSGYTVMPAPDRKGIFAGINKNLDLGFLKWVPKDAVSFSASTIDPMSIYDALIGAARAYDPALGEEVAKHLAAMEQQIGFSIRDDLFGSIGESMVSWSLPMASITNPPEVAFLIKVNDEAKVVKVVKALTALSHGMVELEEAEKRGVKTYQFKLNLNGMRGMGGMMNLTDVFNPNFAFKNGYLVGGFSPSDIRQVFKRMDRTEDDPKGDIRGNKEFAACAAGLPEGIHGVSFTDWKAQFESFYLIVSSLLAFLPQNEDIPFDMQMLPDAATLTKHLYGSLSYSSADGTGLTSTVVSPFGPEMMLLFGGVVAGITAAVVGMRGRF